MPNFIVTELIEIKVTSIIQAENAAKAKRLYKSNKEIGTIDCSEESHITVGKEKNHHTEVKNND